MRPLPDELHRPRLAGHGQVNSDALLALELHRALGHKPAIGVLDRAATVVAVDLGIAHLRREERRASN